MTIRFSNKLVAELFQPFWAALQAGEFLTDAAAVAQTHRHRGLAWLREAGGVRPRRGRDLRGRYLAFGEREEIALGLARGESMRQIAERLGRNVSTISREVTRNRDGQGRYRASIAHASAYERASRPKPAKLRVNVALRWRVEQDLGKKYSPEQIAGRLRADFPDQPEMWVSTETIYQSLYVQSRGALRRELTAHLRTGRVLRSPSRKPGQRKNRIPDMINISQRPPEVADRAVPGHWEGDLIIGKRNLSAIGTLVERTSGYTMLLHLPEGYRPEQVRDALAAEDPNPSRDAAGVVDLGPGTGDARLAPGGCRGRHRHFLLRSARTLAARHQREHQWATAAVLPQGQRPRGASRGRAGPGRRRTQRPAPQTARIPQTGRGDR